MPTTELRQARTAVVITFGANGLAYASFISRIPALGDTLELSTAQLGLLLLCLSGGAISGLPPSGPLIERITPDRAVLAGSLVR